MTVTERIPSAVSAPRAGTAAGRAGFTAAWPSAAAWGAGLILLALGAAGVTQPSSGVVARALGVLLVGVGLAALVWGAVNLWQARLVAARIALTGATVGVLAAFALLAASPARTSVYAVAAGTLLLVVAAAYCARATRSASRSRDAGTLRGILGLLIAAAIIAVIVTPALGATQDASLLRDDGTVPTVTHDGH